jgi:hypothetical protein
MQRFLNLEKEDFKFSQNGDFTIKNGDIEDTFKYQGLGFIEEVEIRIKSSYGDWYFDEDKGANLHLYEGRMITESLLDSIVESISNAFTNDDFLSRVDFEVLVKQVDMHEVAVKLNFSDNIKKYIDYRIQDVRIIFDLKNATPRIVRS